jgi:hypothetical protein
VWVIHREEMPQYLIIQARVECFEWIPLEGTEYDFAPSKHSGQTIIKGQSLNSFGV